MPFCFKNTPFCTNGIFLILKHSIILLTFIIYRLRPCGAQHSTGQNRDHSIRIDRNTFDSSLFGKHRWTYGIHIPVPVQPNVLQVVPGGQKEERIRQRNHPEDGRKASSTDYGRGRQGGLHANRQGEITILFSVHRINFASQFCNGASFIRKICNVFNYSSSALRRK